MRHVHRLFADIVIRSRPLCTGLMLLVLPAAVGAAADDRRWVLVDTRTETLTVMYGDRAQITLHNIAIGRFGTSMDRRRADNTTPLGRFRVNAIRRDSAFRRFISLDYPSVELAERAHRQGAIGDRELQAIRRAHRRGEEPPQDTALGGQIGIHGLGQGDPALHESVNWTRGCVALTDPQIDTLIDWIEIGMPVEIR